MIALILFSAVSLPSYAKEKDKPGKSQFSGVWIFENKEKPTPGKIALLSFTLNLKQNGDKITGKYDYITYNATRIREGKIEGIVKDNKAVLKFKNPEYKWEKGSATLKPVKGGMEWEMTESPQGEHFIPLKSFLKKKKEEM